MEYGGRRANDASPVMGLAMHGFIKFCAVSARILGILALLMVVGGTLGYGFGVLPLRPALFGVAGGFFAGAAAVVLGLVAVMVGGRHESRMRRLGLVGLTLGLLAAIVPGYYLLTARGVPTIHDISTDTADPPAFVAVADLRKDAPNPASYAGVETARKQSQSYPDIQTIEFDGSVEQAFDRALTVAKDMGWTVQEEAKPQGRIEATDTTLFFRFKDDIVVRIRPQGDKALVDVRSKSRVGLSDLGANAARIRAFRERLLAAN